MRIRSPNTSGHHSVQWSSKPPELDRLTRAVVRADGDRSLGDPSLQVGCRGQRIAVEQRHPFTDPMSIPFAKCFCRNG